MLYVAMFDEVNEGTAIFKSVTIRQREKLLPLEVDNKPSDQYLCLRAGGKILRGEEPLPARMPER
jgi:hypothetical protein